MPKSEWEPCREEPPCGTPVIDRRQHRRWHERVFIQAEEDRPAPDDGGAQPWPFIGTGQP